MTKKFVYYTVESDDSTIHGTNDFPKNTFSLKENALKAASDFINDPCRLKWSIVSGMVSRLEKRPIPESLKITSGPDFFRLEVDLESRGIYTGSKYEHRMINNKEYVLEEQETRYGAWRPHKDRDHDDCEWSITVYVKRHELTFEDDLV
jgi:hypothetical protein